MNDTREVRCLMTGLEVIETRQEHRSAPGRKYPGTLRGYASVCGPLSQEMADEKGRSWKEKVAPGAWARAMETCDARALVNHDPNQLIGRSKAGTLRMTENELGLQYEIDLPDTALAHDVAELVKRGDLDGSSISFDVEPGGDSWDHSTTPPTRTIRSFSRMYDLGPVTFPAFSDTSCAMRSLDRSLEASSVVVPEPPLDNRDVSWSLCLASARLRLAEASSPL